MRRAAETCYETRIHTTPSSLQIDVAILRSARVRDEWHTSCTPTSVLTTSDCFTLRSVESESGLLQSPFPAYPWASEALSGPPPLLTSLCHRERFVGAANSMTGIKEAAFWGDGTGSTWVRQLLKSAPYPEGRSARHCGRKGFVVAGSDCGHALVFDRRSAELTCALKADVDVVNCVRPHPTLPLLATSGIENVIRLWAPRLAHGAGDAASSRSRAGREENGSACVTDPTPLRGPTAPQIAARATTDPARLARIVLRNCSSAGLGGLGEAGDHPDGDSEGGGNGPPRRLRGLGDGLPDSLREQLARLLQRFDAS